MPTSTIFENIKVTDPRRIEAFVEDLEAAEREREKRRANKITIPFLSDVNEIRKLMAKRFPELKRGVPYC